MRVKNVPPNERVIYLIAAIGTATPFLLPPLRHRQTTDEGRVMTNNHALRRNLSYHDGLAGNCTRGISKARELYERAQAGGTEDAKERIETLK